MSWNTYIDKTVLHTLTEAKTNIKSDLDMRVNMLEKVITLKQAKRAHGKTLSKASYNLIVNPLGGQEK